MVILVPLFILFSFSLPESSDPHKFCLPKAPTLKHSPRQDANMVTEHLRLENEQENHLRMTLFHSPVIYSDIRLHKALAVLLS